MSEEIKWTPDVRVIGELKISASLTRAVDDYSKIAAIYETSSMPIILKYPVCLEERNLCPGTSS